MMNEENGKTQLTVEELSALLPEGYALVEKDGWIPRQQAEEQLRALSFDRQIDLELTRCGAKSLTAARALLDLNQLRENPDGVASAVGKIRKENDWLFQKESTFSTGAVLTPRRSVDTESMTDAEYYAYRKQMKG
ncbi:MAG: phage scaffolding protein [Clostridia bacterium]|nr:phage scaffolding protein [Clostridia bacterium]